MFSDCYRNCRVLLTGHTGFKGSWLALWLQTLGAEIIGLSLPPEIAPSHWDLLKLDCKSYNTDIRDQAAVQKIVTDTKPEIVFHMAAQSLVRRSYRQPLETWSTNVMGTANLLESCRQTGSAKAIVVITTDKCYENTESQQGYKETDRLGGHDPYSASKASTELVSASYRDAYFSDGSGPLLATARAGNVIGGGDWSDDRIIPDLVRAQEKSEPLIIRSPNAIRPWQHVLEPLAGYLQLGQSLLEGHKSNASAWNFGPPEDHALSVSSLLTRIQECWPSLNWQTDPAPNLHETTTLKLNSDKARAQLSWHPILSLDQQLKMTVEWYRAWYETRNITSRAQLDLYINEARRAGAVWC